MSVQGYVLVRLTDTLGQAEEWELINRFEAIEGVDFASRVVGSYDFVLAIDTPTTIERTLTDIQKASGKGDFVPLTTSDVFNRHREIRDLEILRNL
jgi:hypothetical protein